VTHLSRDIPPCIVFKVNWRFEWTCRLRIQEQTIIRAIKQLEMRWQATLNGLQGIPSAILSGEEVCYRRVYLEGQGLLFFQPKYKPIACTAPPMLQPARRIKHDILEIGNTRSVTKSAKPGSVCDWSPDSSHRQSTWHGPRIRQQSDLWGMCGGIKNTARGKQLVRYGSRWIQRVSIAPEGCILTHRIPLFLYSVPLASAKRMKSDI
jgi:hypothetical protein